MNKITVIQLLNKIANGEELPNKIKYEGTIYERYEYNNKYYENGDRSRQKDILSEHLANESFYNSGIEIIEEDKEIEEIHHCCMETDNQEIKFCVQNINDLADKINEIIRNNNIIMKNFDELKKGK